MPVAQDSRLASRVALASLGLAALFVLWACAAALRDQLTVLFADDWRILDHYQSRPLLAYLFGSENGHRLPATLALFAVDFEWFGGRMRTLVIASIALAFASVGVLAWTFRRQGVLGRALPRVARATTTAYPPSAARLFTA